MNEVRLKLVKKQSSLLDDMTSERQVNLFFHTAFLVD